MATPMMQQYRRIKAEHRDAVLFYRLGDFYEMFEEDARQVSRLLGLTLTQRQGIPMCGVPHHASHSYVGRLLRAGKKVAICEQTTVPAKGLAHREVVEVLSPATVFDEDFLDPETNNHLLSCCARKGRLFFAWTDASTGDFAISETEDSADAFSRELSRIDPTELLIEESLRYDRERYFVNVPESTVVTAFPDWSFDSDLGFDRITGYLGVHNLAAFEIEKAHPVLAAIAVLFQYLEDNAKHALVHIRTIRWNRNSDFVVVDEATHRNLEIVRNMRDGSGAYTLFSVMNRCSTAMGSRLLRKWVTWPLRDRATIERRLNRVESLYHDQSSLYEIRAHLKRCFDLERLIGRLGVEKAHAKDLSAISETIAVGLTVLSARNDDLSVEGAEPQLKHLSASIRDAIADEPPIVLSETGIIRDGYDEELDKLRRVSRSIRVELDDYLAEQKRETGVASLKIKYNRVLGHFFELPPSQTNKLPDVFIRRQSLTNVDRFSTIRLGEIEASIHNSADAALARERELFLSLRKRCVSAIPVLTSLARYLAEIDALQSLAWLATEKGYAKPEIVNDPVIEYTAGRHPVVEANMPAGSFVANDLSLGGVGTPRFALVTGPNMAGKSTVLRQTALIALMAHAGSYVPAESARVGLTDRIFCRVGASDNIARGESTFLIEMNETANILRNATDASLVIMDEVGRGTSTHDGLAIAWATIEYLLEHVATRALFATHYHELTAIEHRELINLSMAVEHAPDIVFLKRLVPGATDRSYGIDVAKIAGIPLAVVDRARALLASLETNQSIPKEPPVQHDLFSHAEIIAAELRNLALDDISPREALDILYRWKEQSRYQREP